MIRLIENGSLAACDCFTRFVRRYGSAARTPCTLFLAVITSLGAFAECHYHWSESDHGWYIDCTVDGFIPGDGGGEGGGGEGVGGGGGCSNCTAMSPEVCLQIKNGIELSLLAFDEAIMKAYEDVWRAEANYTDIEGEAAFLIYYNTENYPDVTALNWFVENAVPSLEYIQSLAEEGMEAAHILKNDLNDIQNAWGDFYSITEQLNCSECSSGGGSSPPSDPSDPTPPSSGVCPCKEAIDAVQNAILNCVAKLDDIKSKLASIDSTLSGFEAYLDAIKSDVYKIRQTTDRMDDFFKDDTEINFSKLIEHVLKLSNALVTVSFKMPENLYWQEYTNATEFTTADDMHINWSEKGEKILAGQGEYEVDFAEYTSLNWFQRIEFLLGDIAGIFNKTNSASADFNEDQKRQIDEVSGDDAWSSLTYEQPKSILEGMISSVQQVESSLNPFAGLFTDPPVSKITILPDVSVESELLQNTFPTVQVDMALSGSDGHSLNSLLHLSHSITTFLWFVMFFLIDVYATYRFVLLLVAVNRWYWKVYGSWSSTLFSSGR